MTVPGMREALSRMCYREVKPGTWAKPVGVVLFTYEEERREWTNWYLCSGGEERSRFDAHTFPDYQGCQPFDDDPLGWLKTCEAWTRTSVGAGGSGDGRRSEFELSADPEAVLEGEPP